MAQQNFVKLASQGRAYDASRAWTEDELKALLEIESALGVDRMVAADYIRNGLRTVAECRKAQEANYAPMSLDELRAKAVSAHVADVRAELGLVDETEEVVETEVVVSEETTPEEVVEPEEVTPVAPKAKSNKKAATNQ